MKSSCVPAPYRFGVLASTAGTFHQEGERDKVSQAPSDKAIWGYGEVVDLARNRALAATKSPEKVIFIFERSPGTYLTAMPIGSIRDE